MSDSPTTPPIDEALRREALSWFVRRQDEDWTADDEIMFEAWLASNPEHGLAYAQCADRWERLDDMPPDLVAGLRIGVATSNEPARQSRRQFWRPAFALGALACVSSVGYLSWRYYLNNWTGAFATAQGELDNVDLPDGSHIQLDTATQVAVAFHADRREVHLSGGQAAFAVTPDASRPFDVLAGPLRITVVGTRFAVRYTPDSAWNEGVTVGVEEGHVRVARVSSGPEDVAMLGAGQQLSSNQTGVWDAVTDVPIQEMAAWRERRVVFADVPLGQAVAELDRYGSTGLRIPDPDIAALRLTGTFDAFDKSAFLRALPRVLPVRLQKTGDQIDIVPKD